MDLPIGIFLIIVGLVVLYLDIFKWGWFSENQHRKPISMYDWIEDKWGGKGSENHYRHYCGFSSFCGSNGGIRGCKR